MFLLFLALLPQFIDPDAAWPIGAQIVALGLVHVASCAVIYTGVGTGARIVLGTRPAAATAVDRFSGAAMVVIGVILLRRAADQLNDLDEPHRSVRKERSFDLPAQRYRTRRSRTSDEEQGH